MSQKLLVILSAKEVADKAFTGNISPDQCRVLFHRMLDGIAQFNSILLSCRCNWADAFAHEPLTKLSDARDLIFFRQVIESALPDGMVEKYMGEMTVSRAVLFGYHAENQAEHDYLVALWQEAIAVSRTRLPSFALNA